MKFDPEHLRIAAQVRKRAAWRWRFERLALLVFLVLLVIASVSVGAMLTGILFWLWTTM